MPAASQPAADRSRANAIPNPSPKQSAWLAAAILAMIALIGLTSIKGRWRTTWGAVGMTTARV